MQVVRGLEGVERFRGGYASIGNFDGVHRGHPAMLDVLTHRARSENAPSIAITFDPHPIALLHPKATPPPLTSIEYRAELLARHGVDVTVVLQTDPQLLSLKAQEFFDDIVRIKLDVKGLVEGSNFFFGCNRSGNITVLRSLCDDCGLSLDVVPSVTIEEQLVSSSVIRSLIASGDIAHAVRLLGQPHRIRGTVCRGSKRGRTLGFPTANLMDVKTLMPSNGVYAALVNLDDVCLPAAVHIGPNPTFGENASKTEVHIIDFSGDIYERTLDVDVLDRVRNVKSFSTVDQLVDQLQLDIDTARKIAVSYLNARPQTQC